MAFQPPPLKITFQLWIEAMQTIENLPIEKRREMRELILKEFTWELIASKWKGLFESAPP